MTPPLTFRTWLVDTLERAFFSLVQALVVFLPLLVGEWGTDLARAILAAGFVAVGSVVLNALTARMPTPASFAADALLRIVRTFAVTVLSLTLATGFDLFSLTAWRTAGTAGLVAVAALVKALAARWRPATITPASFARDPLRLR